MLCPQCQHPNTDTAKFCEECGTRCVHVCPHCGHEGSAQAKFCEECATPVAGEASSSSPALPMRRGADAEGRFYALVSEVMALLQRERRVTYRRLQYIFTVDEAFLQEIREELTFTQFARDEAGKDLVWIGETQPAVQPIDAMPSPPATADLMTVVSSPTAPTLPPPVPETRMPSHGPTVPAEAIATDAPQDESRLPTSPPALPLKPNVASLR
jgi:hypothetical protein